MAECECGGPDVVIICPKGCGCICWDDPEWGKECISYCEGEELPDPDGRVAPGAIVVQSPRKLDALRIDPGRNVRICAHDLPLRVLARLVSQVLGADVWIPVLAGDRRVSTEYEGTVSDVCGHFGWRL